MTTDTKAVARWDAGMGVNPRANGKYVLFTDHEQVVDEWTRLAHEARRNALSAEAKNAELRAALAAKSAEVEGLRAGIEKALDEIEDDGPKALKYAAQELRAAMEKSNEHQDQ